MNDQSIIWFYFDRIATEQQFDNGQSRVRKGVNAFEERRDQNLFAVKGQGAKESGNSQRTGRRNERSERQKM